MSIHNNNIVVAAKPVSAGQRVIKVGDRYFPVGIGGNYIPGGSGSSDSGSGSVILPDVTVTSEAMLDGVTAIVKGVDGSPEVITGSIETVSAYVDGEEVIVPSGYIAEEQSFSISIGTDLPEVHLERDGHIVSISEGMTFGEELEIPFASLYREGRTMRVSEEGYVNTDMSWTVPEARVNQTATQVTVSPGYVEDELTFTISSGEGSGGSTSSGGFDVVKVTEYTPPLVIDFTLSGFTDLIIDEEDPDEGTIPYSMANGQYYVTYETENETDWRKREYYTEDSPCTIRYRENEDEPEYSSWELWNHEGYWLTLYTDNDGGPTGPAGDLSSISGKPMYWGDWEWEPRQAVLNVTGSGQATIKGQKASSYLNGKWVFSNTEHTFTQYSGPDNPVPGTVFTASGDILIGSYIELQGPWISIPFNGDMSVLTARGSVSLTFPDGPTFFTDAEGLEGVKAVWFQESELIDTDIDVSFFQGNATISVDVYQQADSRQAFFAANSDGYIGVDTHGGTYNMWLGTGRWDIIESDGDQGRGSIEVMTDNWVNVAYVHDASEGKYRLFINGQLAKEVASTKLIGKGKTLRIGAWGNGSYRFSGQMRNFRIYDKALTGAEITQLMGQ